MTVTFFDSERDLLDKYPDAGGNVEFLRKALGEGNVLFNIDAARRLRYEAPRSEASPEQIRRRLLLLSTHWGFQRKYHRVDSVQQVATSRLSLFGV